MGKATWAPPAMLDEYRIVRLLGSGAMGHVYLAHDTLLDRGVAIKFIAQRRPDEAARRRFLVEARALARLSHPHVIAVHRAGEADRHPYLVTELVTGAPLSELSAALPEVRVIAVGLALARGLAAAHRRGVLHRDIKPANAVLGDGGEIKLIDFGLADVVTEESSTSLGAGARHRTGDSEWAGTPLYAAPEVLRGEPATARSDIHSLGALLYELATRAAPRDVLPLGADDETWIKGSDPAVEERLSVVSRPLADLILRCLALSPGDRPASAEALADALAVLAAKHERRHHKGNPYRGLAMFEPEHKDLFFGRAGEAQALSDRLREVGLVVVAGDSGVGKSSLCRAGVVPLVAAGALEDERRYETVVLVPGRRPCSALVAAIASALSIPEASLVAEGAPLQGGARAVRGALGRARGLLVVLDQGEELLTLADPEEARGAAELLANLASPAAGCVVLVAVRSDFITRLSALPGLGEEARRGLYLVRPLSRDGVRAAITGPAAQQDVVFEPSSLVDDLASSMESSGSLPLLQFALAELWQQKGDARVIDPPMLESIGGVDGALARHADAVIASLSETAGVAARRVLSALVTPEGTRARQPAVALGPSSAAREEALGALVRGRLLVVTPEGAETAYELAHEALIRKWDTLQLWLADDGEQRARRQRIERAAAEWERFERSAETLLSGKRLADADRIAREDLSPAARAFVEVSRQRARRDRWRRIGAFSAGPLVIAAALGGLRAKQSRDLDRLVTEHRSAAEQALVEAAAHTARASRTRTEAYAAFDAVKGANIGEVLEKRNGAEAAWTAAVQEEHAAETLLVRAGQSLESGLALDPTRRDLRDAIGDVTLARLSLAEAFHRVDRREDLLLRLESYDEDGSRRGSLSAVPTLVIRSSPPGATVTLERYDGRTLKAVAEPATPLGVTPLQGVAIARGPGSYRLTFTSPGRTTVRYPVLLGPGERFEADVALPAESDSPRGYVYVPAGRFLTGSAEPDTLRKGFLMCAPLHETRTGAYWISRHEVTFGDWMAFLSELTGDERKARLPSTQSGMWGVELTEEAGGFRLRLTLQGETHVAGLGEPVRLSARDRRGTIAWERLPVTGVSMEDAQQYFGWLDRTGRVTGARSCTDLEWERAARGADGRSYPHGESFSRDDANIDETYGRAPFGYGPDEAGSHPASDSPFGVGDMMGNVSEATLSMARQDETVMHGGTWYFDVTTALVPNRSFGEMRTRDYMTGMRACATAR